MKRSRYCRPGMDAAPLRHLGFEWLHQPDGWLHPGYLTLDAAGTIARVAGTAPEGDVERFAGFAVPGMPNLHSHAFQRLLSGRTEHRSARGGEDSFWTWREQMYDFALRLDPDQVQAVTAQVQVEMLKAGMTTVGEFHYLHRDPDGHPYADPAELSSRVLEAARATGIGLCLLPVLYLHGGPGQPPAPEQRRFAHRDLGEYLATVGLVRARAGGEPRFGVGLALHSLRAVTPDEIVEAVAAFDRVDAQAPVHIHVAEQEREVELCVEQYGARPVACLVERVGIGPR